MVILGLVQGLTEFLPVSSTAHLIFAQAFLGITRPGILLEAVLHLGTALAALVLFWADVRRLLAGWWASLTGRACDDEVRRYGRLAWLIVAITAITAAVGLALADPFERMFGSLRGTAFQLVLTGAILFLARRSGERTALEAGAADAVAVGLAQAAAIVPGISRSGTTIAAATWLGMRGDEAARLSFLAAIPAVAGAGLFGLKDLPLGAALGYTPVQLAAGFVASLISGALAIRWLLAVVRRGRLAGFAVYCVVAGAAVLAAAGR
ncbi:MAG: undecaprenyl-diphosphate phosphatase [Armatimonadota bacterium]|nr:undecaprenyl-diphosphate phosphatase [Armatimonadota bacterium]